MKKIATIFLLCVVGRDTYTQIPSLNSAHLNKKQLNNSIDSIEEALDKKTQFRFQSAYMNKVIFAGRNFGVDQFGATLGATYRHKSGINLECNGNYWNAMDIAYALTDVGIYYEKPILKNLYLTAGYWRLFYTNGDAEERNLFTDFFMIDQSWFTSIGQLNWSYYFIHGNETAHRLDINFSRSLDVYRFLKADKISIEPTITATFATLNYLIFLSSIEEVSIEDEGAFAIGNYEFSLPVAYKRIGKFEINAAWHYAMPVAFEAAEQVPPISYFTFEIVRILFMKK